MLKFNLIENAQDSLEHAISHLTRQDEPEIGDFKRVILDLSHVTELLLKERLRRVHPAFLFSNVDKFPSQNAHTVTADCALQRLMKIGNLSFDDEDSSALKTIRQKRNDIEHYEFVVNEKEAKIVIGNILVFIFRFSSDELGLDWAERRLEDPLWSKLNRYAEFYEAQLAYIHEQIDGALPTIGCPVCYNDVFDVESEICMLCGHREEVQDCSRCHDAYLPSTTEFETNELCKRCEYEDGYAAANFEKY